MRTRTITAVSAAVFIVATSAGCQSGDAGSPATTSTTTSTSASTAPPPPLPPPPAGPLVQVPQLKGLMPDPGQVSAAVNVPNLGISESHDSLDLLPDDYASDMTCVSALSDAAIQPYSETPVVLVRTQDYAPADGSGTFLATVSAVLYETAQDAQDLVTSTVNAWHGCAGKQIQVKMATPATFTVGTASVAGGVNTVVNNRTAPPGPGWACGRGITARNNVVIDLTVCGSDPAAVGAGATALVNQIVAKVPA
ncbi:sensor domain-containing protein [Mycobacterium sp. 360MFTsu5.1]|uniref:sensor domain-containing protein n=1 Tax=Mycobacterium sp. 360MFTsu5.1 TaxID=1172186 RepID=UPI00037B1987|nr:sensor domain-containing protein [Mycobacterium sp. 360MFTsu5.1]